MNEEEGRREPAGVGACFSHCDGSQDGADRVRLNTDGSVSIASIDELSEWILDVAMTRSDEVASMAHRVRCLRAARGGNSNSSQTAGRFLAHPRLKSVTLTNDHRAVLERAAKAQEALQLRMVAAISTMLELELHWADLQRCEDAMEGKRGRDIEQKESGIWPEARTVVARLARAGILEGHWSTVTQATEDRIAGLILADNASAGVGSPNNPQIS